MTDAVTADQRSGPQVMRKLEVKGREGKVRLSVRLSKALWRGSSNILTQSNVSVKFVNVRCFNPDQLTLSILTLPLSYSPSHQVALWRPST